MRYIQAQYESHQDSQDQLERSGTSLDKDRFSIRRARAALIGEWEYAAMALELDANTTNGPQVDLRKAEASLQYRPDRRLPPLAMATIGLFDAPFGYELDESPRTRFFMERSTGSRAFFPGEPDLGLRLAGALGFFRWTIAALNGVPLGAASSFVVQNPTGDPGRLLPLRRRHAAAPDLQVAGDVSPCVATVFTPGLHPAARALQWQDPTKTARSQASELAGVAAQSARRLRRTSITGRSAQTCACQLPVLAGRHEDLRRVRHRVRTSTAGLYVADPVVDRLDTSERSGYYVGVIQESRSGASSGCATTTTTRTPTRSTSAAAACPFSEAITTWSPMAALVLPDRARLILQYDSIHNAFARTAVGVPTNLQDNVLTLRLQVQL